MTRAALSVDLADLASGVHDVSQRRQTVMPGDVKLAKGGRVHKWRLDRNGGHIGAHEFIRPRSNGMFFIESMMNGQVRPCADDRSQHSTVAARTARDIRNHFKYAVVRA